MKEWLPVNPTAVPPSVVAQRGRVEARLSLSVVEEEEEEGEVSLRKMVEIEARGVNVGGWEEDDEKEDMSVRGREWNSTMAFPEREDNDCIDVVGIRSGRVNKGEGRARGRTAANGE